MNSRFSYYTISRMIEQSDEYMKYEVLNLIKKFYDSCTNKKSQINWDSLLVNYKDFLCKPKYIQKVPVLSFSKKVNISISSEQNTKLRLGFSDLFKSEYKAFVNINKKASNLNKSLSYFPTKLRLINKKKSKKSKMSSKISSKISSKKIVRFNIYFRKKRIKMKKIKMKSILKNVLIMMKC